MVVPQADVDAIRNHIADPQFQVISETDLIPELRLFRPERIGGWQLQQLIKLSAARIVSSPFFLTLDADVVCVRHIEYSDLIQDQRAIANVYDSDRDVHGEWYEWSEKVLGFPRSGRIHGVTPAVLSAEGVRRLFTLFEERLKPNALRAETYLISHRPWTEYTLYYTFLEHTGLFDTYHFPASTRTYQNSIWKVGGKTRGIRCTAFQPSTASTSLCSRAMRSTPQTLSWQGFGRTTNRLESRHRSDGACRSSCTAYVGSIGVPVGMLCLHQGLMVARFAPADV